MEKFDKKLKEDLLQRIKKKDFIQSILDTVQIYLQNQLSQEFFNGVFEPLVSHAISNNKLEYQIHIYAQVVAEILFHTNTRNTVLHNSILRGLLVLTKESIMVSRGAVADTNITFGLSSLNDQKKLINLLQLTTEAISLVICSDTPKCTSPMISSFWDYLPQIFHLSLSNRSTHFAEAFVQLCQECVDNRFDDLGHGTVEDLLVNLLYALKQKNAPEDIINMYASAISHIAHSGQALTIDDELKLSSLVNELAFDPDLPRNMAKLNAIKDISHMMIEKDIPTPWLDSLSKLNIDRQLEYNPLDSSVTSSNQALSDSVEEIVRELVSLELVNERAQDLLSKLKQVASSSKTIDISTLCQPNEKEIAELVTRMLPVHPDFAENIISLLDYKIPQYLQVYLPYALPFAVLQEDDDAICAIASSLEVSIENLCIKCAHDVIVALFLQEDPAMEAYGTKRLQQFAKQKVKILARDSSIKVVTILAMKLGIPEWKDRALDALLKMKQLTRNSNEQLADYISDYFIAILDKVSKFISDKRNQVKNPQDPHALEALREVMVLLKSNISDHVYVMNIFQSVSEISDMQLDALRLWEDFIASLDLDSLRSHVNRITQGLCNMVSIVKPTDRIRVADVLRNLLVKENWIEPAQYADLPALPDFKQLESIKTYIEQKKLKRNIVIQRKHDMKLILSSFSNADTAQVQLGLKKLRELLQSNVNIGSNLGELYSKLLYLLQKYAGHRDISYLVSLCLGKLGAVDPGLVNVPIVDDTVFVMNNFGRVDENLNFICDLITNHIYPAYNTVRDEETRQSIEYSIQTLLKQAGYEPVADMKRNTSKLTVYHHWRRLPKWTQEFLTPFLQSHYHVAIAEYRGTYPIFSRVKIFQDWVHHWYSQMTNGSRSPAKEVFSACIPISECKILGVALHLLPYLVLHIILAGTPDDTRNIIHEIISVLNTNAEPDSSPGRSQMNQHALQVVVAITEYCRKFLNRVGPNDREKQSQVKRVSNFLKLIPTKIMGIAAYRTRAYPQALMQFETYIKENNIKIQEDSEISNYLRQIYIQIEDPVDLEVLLSIYTAALSQDQEIVRYETDGQWQMAEALYSVKITEDPSDLSACTGYMDCFKKSGNYGGLIYAANKLLVDAPNWQPQINSFRIDSAWRMKDWSTLDKATSSAVQRDIQALIGCILNSAMKNCDIDVACLMEESRRYIIEQLTMSAAQSYRKAYPHLFNLQMLQEIEESQKIWTSNNPELELCRLEQEWKSRRKLLIPRSQYKLNLLELRKAAFFDIRPSSQLHKHEARLWLEISKANRKAGNMHLSLSALETATRLSDVPLYREKAKLFWKSGYRNFALRILEDKYLDKTIKPLDALLVTHIFQENMQSDPDDSTSGSKMRGYLNIAMKITDPEKIENAYHNCIAYFSNLYPPNHPLDENKLKVMDYLFKTSSRALQCGSKYYYSSMSTLINIWFDFVKLQKDAEQPSTPTSKLVKKHTSRLPELMEKFIEPIPDFQWSLFLTRLISHLSTDNEAVANCIRTIVERVFTSYPRNSIWLMIGPMDPLTPKVSRSVTTILDRAIAKNPDTVIPTIIKQATTLKAAFYKLSTFPIDTNDDSFDLSMESELHTLCNMKDLELLLPKENTLLPSIPEILRRNESFAPFQEDLPRIKRFEKRVVVMRSLQKPKRISIIGSNGQSYRFLIKSIDDMRKDARVMEFNYMINSFLKKNAESRDSDLYIRTYAVIPLGPAWGLIEWIDNLVPLKGVVNDLWIADGYDSVNDHQVRYSSVHKRIGLGREKTQYFEDLITSQCPSVFYKWFLDTFPEPNQWLNSRTRYVKTLAVMSIVGYIIGLGDRHAENVTFDSTNGDCVHVDLNMLFDSGRILPVPECVPFRLTHNLVGAMGVLGYKGLFQHTCETTLSVLLSNKDSLVSVFQTYINEKEYSENPKRSGSRSTRSTTNHIMPGLQEKVCIKRTEIKEVVGKLLRQATNSTNLSQLYPGWAAYV